MLRRETFLRDPVNDFNLHIEDSPNRDRTFVDRIVESVDRVTKAPDAVRRVADNIEDQLKKTARTIQDRAAPVAEKNLTQSTITGYFTKFGRWVQQGNNMWYALGAVAVIIYLVRAGK